LDKIKEVDFAFLDGTFYDAAEVGYRDISEIPHPFIVESLSLFESLDAVDRKKIYFIHFNHTNPLLNPESDESKNVLNLGFQIAREGMVFKL
jgi:pyrroloquinoline quinone biosynthesis protein B